MGGERTPQTNQCNALRQVYTVYNILRAFYNLGCLLAVTTFTSLLSFVFGGGCLSPITAKLAQLKRGESGPLRPEDLLEARRRLAASGKAPPLCSSSSRAPGSGGTGGIGEVVARGKRRRLGGGSTLVRGSAI